MKGKSNVKCCNGSHLIAHLFAIAGMYILTWGLVGSGSWNVVLKSPIFWGLFLLGIAKCTMMASHYANCKA